MGNSKQKKSKDTAAYIQAEKAAAFFDESPAKAFEHFKDLALQIPTENLPVFTGQPLLMRANIHAALAILEPHLEQAVLALRKPKLASIFELPSLVMGLDFAAARVPVAKLSAGEIDQMLSEGAPWRELLLSYLEVASHPLIALLPRERVAAIRSGQGKLDKAQDFVALAGLFAEYSNALSGKHPFAPDSIDRLSILGGALLQQIKPGKAIAVSKRGPESLLKDQFAQLVSDRYDQLQVIAAVALGKRKADELLPALRSAAGISKPGQAEERGSEKPA